MTTVETKAPAEVRKFPLTTLIAMVVGSMVGAGVFSLPRNFALATGVFGALIAWVIAGTGMLMLAFVFQTLAVRKPDLDAGVYAYAKAGFGEYLGFFSAFGYWASACVGNITYWVLISSTLGLVWPGVFGHGDTLAALALGSAGLWIFHILISRGGPGGCRHQQDRDGGQDRADPDLHRGGDLRAEGARVRRELVGRRAEDRQRPV